MATVLDSDIDYSDGGGHWIQWYNYAAEYKPPSKWTLLRVRFAIWKMNFFRLWKSPIDNGAK